LWHHPHLENTNLLLYSEPELLNVACVAKPATLAHARLWMLWMFTSFTAWKITLPHSD